MSYDNTALNSTIDEKWDMDLEEARYANAVIMPRITNRSSIVKKSGDTINVTVKGKYAANDVGSGGSLTTQTISLTSVPILIDKHKEVTAETEDKAMAQSFWNPESDFPVDAGKAMAEQVDTDIANLYSDLTTNVIGSEASPVEFDDVPLRAAMLKLADLNIPLTELSWLLPPVAFYKGLFTQDRFTDADRAGLPKNVLTTNFRFPLLGVPAFESTLLATVGESRKAMLLHKSAMAIAMQLNNTFKRADRTASLVLSSVVSVNSLYGVKTIREDHGVLVNVKKD